MRLGRRLRHDLRGLIWLQLLVLVVLKDHLSILRNHVSVTEPLRGIFAGCLGYLMTVSDYTLTRQKTPINAHSITKRNMTMLNLTNRKLYVTSACSQMCLFSLYLVSVAFGSPDSSSTDALFFQPSAWTYLVGFSTSNRTRTKNIGTASKQ